MSHADLARRFLHVNLNTASLDTAEWLYAGHLGLSARMRTDPAVPVDGSILGIDSETFCATTFLYDIRGGRAGCALEAIEYQSPALSRDPSTDPVRPGIRSALIAVADLAGTLSILRDSGAIVGGPVDGLISGTKSVLVLDQDSVVIELTESPLPAGPTFGGIRIATIDMGATADFLIAIGFAEIDAPKRTKLAGEQLAPAGSAEPVDCMVAGFALPEDGDRFRLTVVQHPATAGQHPVMWGGNRQGLYRCALRVENVMAALSQIPDYVERKGDPVWCPLPGTKIDGLYIAFLRSPDGVVFEFVERPIKHFQ